MAQKKRASASKLRMHGALTTAAQAVSMTMVVAAMFTILLVGLTLIVGKPVEPAAEKNSPASVHAPAARHSNTESEAAIDNE